MKLDKKNYPQVYLEECRYKFIDIHFWFDWHFLFNWHFFIQNFFYLFIICLRSFWFKIVFISVVYILRLFKLILYFFYFDCLSVVHIKKTKKKEKNKEKSKEKKDLRLDFVLYWLLNSYSSAYQENKKLIHSLHVLNILSVFLLNNCFGGCKFKQVLTRLLFCLIIVW